VEIKATDVEQKSTLSNLSESSLKRLLHPSQIKALLAIN
jgi:hypothetical protein